MGNPRILALRWLGLAAISALLAGACGGDPENRVGGGDAGAAVASNGGTSGVGGNGLNLGGRSIAGRGSAAGGTGSSDPCDGFTCADGQSCQVEDDRAVCRLNACDSLSCSDTEECVATPNGGAKCADISCSSDVACPADRYCDTEEGVCKDDSCAPFSRRCDGNEVLECARNGSGFAPLVTCASPSTFVSVCDDQGSGVAGCTCDDEWDCPGYQTCDAGLCRGSGTEPTCRLAPANITSVLPAVEIKWGGAEGGVDTMGRLRLVDGVEVPAPGATPDDDLPRPATDSPWSAFAQIVQTPIVANLDDDNGDGKIDERDVPEILFLGFEVKSGNSRTINANGVLRAIHGGGFDIDGAPKKGRDYLAVCGAAHYHDGTYYDDAGMPTTDNSEPGCGDAQADLDSTSTIAVGDLDYDGKPEIVANGEETGTNHRAINVYDNTGGLIFSFNDPSAQNEGVPGVTLANVIRSPSTEDEFVEIVVGRSVYKLKKENGKLAVDRLLTGTGARGSNGQGPVSCLADLYPTRPGLEIVAGATVYGIPLTEGNSGDLDPTASELVTLATGDAAAGTDGFCAIADVWGSDLTKPPGPANPLDGDPEILVVRNGTVNVYRPGADTDGGVFQGYQLTRIAPEYSLPGTGGGGPPNVDDFDGDGFPELGTASGGGYLVIDFQAATADGGACPAWTGLADDQSSKPRAAPAGSCTSAADCNTGTDMDAWTFGCNVDANVGRGSCVCLHNGWQRRTQDGSSRVTGSSVFDFNGDGAAEVIYNDECHFRLYTGNGGRELFREVSESRTRIEYPIVADVDNDGNAEIVFSTTTEAGFCTAEAQSERCDVGANVTDGRNPECPTGQTCVPGSPGLCNNQLNRPCSNVGGTCRYNDTDYTCTAAAKTGYCTLPDPDGGGPLTNRDLFNNGIEVWGDPSDSWVSARRIWNQHGYHVTNVRENGQIPVREPDSWKPLGKRFYNTYRSQPRSFGVAPDLNVDGVQLTSPDATCGTLSQALQISSQLSNIGDLRVGAGVSVVFEGTWGGSTELLKDAGGDPLTFTIKNSLEPRETLIFQVAWEAAYNGKTTLPDSVRVIVDPPSTVLDPSDTSLPQGSARECDETNNELKQPVAAGDALADLTLSLDDGGAGCPSKATGTVTNDGALGVGDVVVRIYAGDPDVGGKAVGEVTVEGPVEAGASATFDVPLVGIPQNGLFRLFAVVDPDRAVKECNDGNNQAGPTSEQSCNIIQ